jgi:hypothetical protein
VQEEIRLNKKKQYCELEILKLRVNQSNLEAFWLIRPKFQTLLATNFFITSIENVVASIKVFYSTVSFLTLFTLFVTYSFCRFPSKGFLTF